eukprot:TRINITY_DN38721_c0_g1_i1.p1 TRINITY_DN38721_c0_g1~~TRINITY_DN38721_c0_g1_i1.p1  ORF type:complete len:110 (-),score=22.97 TRINITY_DN38721_c0_g1_i1:11-340(-)
MCVGPEAVGTDMQLAGYSLREACEVDGDDESTSSLFFTSTESREKATNLLFEVLGDCQVKDKGLPNLILSTADVIANVTTVSYTHLTLPPKRIVKIRVDNEEMTKNKTT